jgi:hypothetical protein
MPTVTNEKTNWKPTPLKDPVTGRVGGQDIGGQMRDITKDVAKWSKNNGRAGRC